MVLRSALAACAVFAAMAAPAFAEDANSARCEATSFRVYFSHGSTSLDAISQEMLDVAARNVQGCDHRELRVAVDASSPYATQRGRAILAALDDQDWDAARVEARPMTHRVSFNDGPDYAEVTMAPDITTAAPTTAPRTDAGV